LFTIPKNISNKRKVYKKLASIVPKLNYQYITKKVSKRKGYTWLARKIKLDPNQVQGIKDLKGVYIESVPKRIYPNHDVMANVLGFVGIDNTGLAGIEYLFNDELKGNPLVVKYLRDAKGRAIKFESKRSGKKAHDIYLSIDKDLQAVAEAALREAIKITGSKRAGAGVMDAETGEVLAMANYPSFDPNDLKNSSPNSRKNSFLTDPLEPGSIMKVFTVAAALEEKIARPDTNYYCERGKLRIGDHTINESDSTKTYEWLSLSDIIRYSSNIGTTKIAFDVTFPILRKYLTKYGIGSKTGIELPGESRGIFTAEENISPLSLSNISFGQGVATTGIQLLSAFSIIANGGYYIKPTVIIRDANNVVERKRVMSRQTAKELTEMLYNAVEDGTGDRAKIPYFKIAGKTSTAQRPDKNGGYSGHIPGFIGFPLNVKRKFVVYAYVDDPQNNEYYGNQIAAPIFNKITKYVLYKNKEFDSAKIASSDSESNRFDTIKTRASSKRIISKDSVPNFLGLDKKSVSALAKQLKIDFVINGMGVVVKQFPQNGTKISQNTIVKLKFSPPKYD
jgi:cell division protein FtsI/penicillin-binding protein 2